MHISCLLWNNTSLRVCSCSVIDVCFSSCKTQTHTVTLTLLLTSFSLGRMSKVKPSACPRDRLPPFMKLPKASTRPSTCNTHLPLWIIWCAHTHIHTRKKRDNDMKVKLSGRKENEMRKASGSPCILSEGFLFCGGLR